MDKGYGICFNEWLEDDRIKTELRLLIKISSLCAERGYCWASNEFFAKYFKTTTVTISNQIKKLRQLDYLDVRYEKRGTQIKKRALRLKKTLSTVKENFNGTIKENFNGSVKENFKDNSTSNKSISINTISEIEILPSFKCFWNKYNKKIDRPKAEKKWSKLTQKEREQIMQHLEDYIPSTKDKQFRKNPTTYLNNRSWENEIINNQNHENRFNEAVGAIQSAYPNL